MRRSEVHHQMFERTWRMWCWLDVSGTPKYYSCNTNIHSWHTDTEIKQKLPQTIKQVCTLKHSHTSVWKYQHWWTCLIKSRKKQKNDLHESISGWPQSDTKTHVILRKDPARSLRKMFPGQFGGDFWSGYTCCAWPVLAILLLAGDTWRERPPSSQPATEPRALGTTWEKTPQPLEVDRLPCYSVRAMVQKSVGCLSISFCPYLIAAVISQPQAREFCFLEDGGAFGKEVDQSWNQKEGMFFWMFLVWVSTFVRVIGEASDVSWSRPNKELI